jgi:hypothetical protein
MSCQLFPLDFITLIIIGETYKAPVPLKPISTLFPGPLSYGHDEVSAGGSGESKPMLLRNKNEEEEGKKKMCKIRELI